MSALRIGFLLFFVLGCAFSASIPNAPSVSVPDVRSAFGKLLNRPKRSLKAIEQLPFGVPAATRTNDGGSCQWDSGTESCAVSDSAVADLFSKSSNSYAQFVAQFPTCSSVAEADACATTENCFWDQKGSRCMFLEFYVGHEDSPCMVDAAGTLKEVVSQDTCSLHVRPLECFKDRVCHWEFEEHRCDSDDLIFHFGFTGEELIQSANPVIAAKAAQATEQFVTAFDFDDPHFDFYSILGWEVPKTDCPEWADELACVYADGIMTDIAQSYYCGAKYGQHSVFECNADPLCMFDFSSSNCRQPDESFVEGFLLGLYNVAGYVKLPLDRQFLQSSLGCQMVREESECSEPCAWNDEEELFKCTRPDLFVPATLAEQGSSEDPLCRYAEDDTASKCLNLGDDPEACLKNPDCILQPSGLCSVSVDYMVRSVVNKDRKLKRSYDRLKNTCSGRRTRSSCEASPQY